MICPHLKRTVMPICQAKKGAFMAPNIYELQYYCMSVKYKQCTVHRKHYRERRPVRYRGVERRKHQRFKAAIPINIGLISLKRGKAIVAQFKGVTTDISMEGLGLELGSPESGMFPDGKRMMGENREFDVEINAKFGTKEVRAVGEVKWAAVPSRSVLKMGVFLREMMEGEREKWTNFVMSRSKGSSQEASLRKTRANDNVVHL